MVWGTLDSYMQKNQTRLLTHIMHKNKFKWIKDLRIGKKTGKGD